MFGMGDYVELWHLRSQNGQVCIGWGRCKKREWNLVHGHAGVVNCVVVITNSIIKK